MPDVKEVKMKSPRATDPNADNLKAHSFENLSPEERRRLQSKGGKKAAEAKAYRRTFQEATKWALALPAIKGNPTVERIRKQFPGLTNQDALVISVMAEGILKGDVKALQVLRDTAGEAPAQNVNLRNDEPVKITIETVD